MSRGPSNVRAVVAIDLGTTFSGYAYARKSEPDKVFICEEWPYAAKAEAKPYCKTQTSLYYVPDSDGKYHLKAWGWCALVQFTKAAEGLTSAKPEVASHLSDRISMLRLGDKHGIAESSRSRSPLAVSNQSSYISDHINLLSPNGFVTERVGYYATNFKLFLAGQDGNQSNTTDQELPGDLTVERLIIDYLRSISGFVIAELQLKYGKHFGKEDVQWCVTVPAIWDERAKQVMKRCAEMAGLVKGPLCPTFDASPYPVDIILEPEGASVYCLCKVKHLNLKKGDKLLVADIGGGTIDLVVHRKVDDGPESLKVEEVAKSYGKLGGGTFVDGHFFKFMSKKIGCFETFCRENQSAALKIYGWWQGIKMGFDGDGYSAELSLPRKLSVAWEKYDSSVGNSIVEDYDELTLNDSDIKRIFDYEVKKILDLIEEQIAGVNVLMVVGGFSASPYLRKEIARTFGRRIDNIIIPDKPGSAICHGAVQLHLQNDIIQSRISKKTYGINALRDAAAADPAEFVFVDDKGQMLCKNCFSVFVRAGETVALHRSVTKEYSPAWHKQKAFHVELYSSTEKFPMFTTDRDVTWEGSFEIGIEAGMRLGRKRIVEVTMCFGGSNIQVTAVRKNFGSHDVSEGLSVTFLN